jgi:hypothetical protein
MRTEIKRRLIDQIDELRVYLDKAYLDGDEPTVNRIKKKMDKIEVTLVQQQINLQEKMKRYDD